MLGSFCRRGLLVAALGLSAWSVQPTFAQQGEKAEAPEWLETEQMPENWQNAKWDQYTKDFVALRGYLNKARGRDYDSDHLKAVREHAWAFLQDPELMMRGDWELLQELVQRVGIRNVDRHKDGRVKRMRELLAARIDQDPGLAKNLDYGRMLQVLKVVHHSGDRDDVLDRKRLVLAEWVVQTDLSAISPHQQLSLLTQLSDSRGNEFEISGRLTGSITLPSAGTYQFERFFVKPSYTDWMRVTIGDAVVLDTSLNDDLKPVVTGPVKLSAGRLPIVVEFARTAGKSPAELMLMWTPPGKRSQEALVPSSAYTNAAGEPGLDASFYTNPSFKGKPAVTKIIPGLVYDRGGFISGHHEACEALKAAIVAPNADRWLGMETKWPAGTLVTALESLDVEERKVVLDIFVREYGELFVNCRPFDFYAVVGMAATSSGDTVVDVVKAWADGRPRLVTKAATTQGNWMETYLSVNDLQTRRRWRLAALSQRRWDLVEQIRETCLSEADGSCDLDVLKLLVPCYTYALDRSVHDLTQYIQEKIDTINPKNRRAGDKIASWYVAKAIVAEHSFPTPRLLVDTRSFELAYASATSEDMRFWVMHEHAARLASMGQMGDLEALLEAAGDGFGAEEHLAAMQACRDTAGKAITTLAKSRQESQLAKLESTLGLLKQRLSRAQERSDQAEIDRYTPRVNKAQAAYTQAKRAFDRTYPEK